MDLREGEEVRLCSRPVQHSEISVFQEDIRQTQLIEEAWKQSGKVYGYRTLHDDLLDQGETSCANRIARLAGIKAQIGYRRRPGSYGGKPSVVVDNTLARQFDVDAPDTAWVTDITHIKTMEGPMERLHWRPFAACGPTW
ncbi:transposase InsO family protein [Devosia subaequoris]|uniref:Transposase InsO family protein n=1 Tax=Devosia subaequoris TaxID=395930 RepID=A0A7W6NA92_9HYPH|nr:transposase InsO family protein [Devosia subaequoris]